MSNILIQKVDGRRETRYVFRPKDYIPDFTEACRDVPGLRYHRSRKYWSADRGSGTLRELNRICSAGRLEWTYALEAGGGKPDRQKPVEKEKRRSTEEDPALPLPDHWADRLIRTEDQLRVRRYSWRTVKSYKSHLRGFFHARRDLMPADITTEIIKHYILERGCRGNFSPSSQNQLLNAIKFWMENVEGIEKTFIELRPRTSQRLPQVLSVSEVKQLLASVDNLKHRCILKIIYGCGLRLGEVCRLQVRDLHFDRREVFIRCSKNRKDRYVAFPNTLVDDLEAYRSQYTPDRWLFEGQHGGAYSERSVQRILKAAVERSGVNPLATVHTLRHSYATHLIERGVSTRHIQELLGHASSRTTEIYTHISSSERRRVGSPLDDL